MPMYEVIFAKRMADVGTVVEMDADEATNLVRWGRLKPVDEAPRRKRRNRTGSADVAPPVEPTGEPDTDAGV